MDDATAAGAPSVDFLNATMPAEAPKSTIGVRKIQPKRGVSGYEADSLFLYTDLLNFLIVNSRWEQLKKVV